MKKTTILTTLFFLGTFVATVSATDIKAVRNGSKINVTIDDRFFTSYHFSIEEKFPFFFPVNGPTTGGSVTSMRNGEYPHHSSLYFGCDLVNGGNYWAGDLESGQILSKEVKIIEQGARVVITDDCIWQRPGAESPLKDTRRIMITAPSKDLWQIDFDITLEMLTDVVVLKTNHSLFAARVAADICVSNGGVMVNAEGNKGEATTDGTPSAWMDYYGKRGNAIEGIAIFQHPANPGFPVAWETRDYGFFSPTPLDYLPDGIKSLSFRKGEKIKLRYRVLIHAGDHKTADIAGQFEQYKSN